MKKTKFVSAVFLCATQAALANNSFAQEPAQKSGDSGVLRVVYVNANTRRLELCTDSSETSCAQLGDRNYSVSELKKLQIANGVSGVGKIVVDAGLVLGGGVFISGAGSLAGGLAGGLSEILIKEGGTDLALQAAKKGAQYGATGGAVLGGTMAGAAAAVAANPIDNFRTAFVLREFIKEGEVARNANIRVSDHSKKALIEALTGSQSSAESSGSHDFSNRGLASSLRAD